MFCLSALPRHKRGESSDKAKPLWIWWQIHCWNGWPNEPRLYRNRTSWYLHGNMNNVLQSVYSVFAVPLIACQNIITIKDSAAEVKPSLLSFPFLQSHLWYLANCWPWLHRKERASLEQKDTKTEQCQLTVRNTRRVCESERSWSMLVEVNPYETNCFLVSHEDHKHHHHWPLAESNSNELVIGSPPVSVSTSIKSPCPLHLV
jgi:hypothetical protein